MPDYTCREPGRFYDRRGVPIYPGDLLRTDHFVEPNGKKHYLYHVAVENDGHLEMVPTSHLAGPKWVRGGGRCWLSAVSTERMVVIISGYGPGDYLDFTDRPRLSKAHRATAAESISEAQ